MQDPETILNLYLFKNYKLRPKNSSQLDDLFLEEKYAIYLCDAYLEDHKDRMFHLKILFEIESLEKQPWQEFLDESLMKNKVMPERDKKQIGLQKKASKIAKLRELIEHKTA